MSDDELVILDELEQNFEEDDPNSMGRLQDGVDQNVNGSRQVTSRISALASSRLQPKTEDNSSLSLEDLHTNVKSLIVELSEKCSAPNLKGPLDSQTCNKLFDDVSRATVNLYDRLLTTLPNSALPTLKNKYDLLQNKITELQNSLVKFCDKPMNEILKKKIIAVSRQFGYMRNTLKLIMDIAQSKKSEASKRQGGSQGSGLSTRRDSRRSPAKDYHQDRGNGLKSSESSKRRPSPHHRSTSPGKRRPSLHYCKSPASSGRQHQRSQSPCRQRQLSPIRQRSPNQQNRRQSSPHSRKSPNHSNRRQSPHSRRSPRLSNRRQSPQIRRSPNEPKGRQLPLHQRLSSPTRRSMSPLHGRSFSPKHENRTKEKSPHQLWDQAQSITERSFHYQRSLSPNLQPLSGYQSYNVSNKFPGQDTTYNFESYFDTQHTPEIKNIQSTGLFDGDHIMAEAMKVQAQLLEQEKLIYEMKSSPSQFAPITTHTQLEPLSTNPTPLEPIASSSFVAEYHQNYLRSSNPEEVYHPLYPNQMTHMSNNQHLIEANQHQHLVSETEYAAERMAISLPRPAGPSRHVNPESNNASATFPVPESKRMDFSKIKMTIKPPVKATLQPIEINAARPNTAENQLEKKNIEKEVVNKDQHNKHQLENRTQSTSNIRLESGSRQKSRSRSPIHGSKTNSKSPSRFAIYNSKVSNRSRRSRSPHGDKNRSTRGDQKSRSPQRENSQSKRGDRKSRSPRHDKSQAKRSPHRENSQSKRGESNSGSGSKTHSSLNHPRNQNLDNKSRTQENTNYLNYTDQIPKPLDVNHRQGLDYQNPQDMLKGGNFQTGQIMYHSNEITASQNIPLQSQIHILPKLGCAKCYSMEHDLRTCQQFTSLSITERWEVLQNSNWAICSFCLENGHLSINCTKSYSCSTRGCFQLNNELLHQCNSQQPPNAREITKNSSSKSVNLICICCNRSEHCLKDCAKFIDMEKDQRLDIVSKCQVSICRVCLAYDHTTPECKSSVECGLTLNCSSRAHPLLHRCSEPGGSLQSLAKKEMEVEKRKLERLERFKKEEEERKKREEEMKKRENEERKKREEEQRTFELQRQLEAKNLELSLKLEMLQKESEERKARELEEMEREKKERERKWKDEQERKLKEHEKKLKEQERKLKEKERQLREERERLRQDEKKKKEIEEQQRKIEKEEQHRRIEKEVGNIRKETEFRSEDDYYRRWQTELDKRTTTSGKDGCKCPTDSHVFECPKNICDNCQQRGHQSSSCHLGFNKVGGGGDSLQNEFSNNHSSRSKPSSGPPPPPKISNSVRPGATSQTSQNQAFKVQPGTSGIQSGASGIQAGASGIQAGTSGIPTARNPEIKPSLWEYFADGLLNYGQKPELANNMIEFWDLAGYDEASLKSLVVRSQIKSQHVLRGLLNSKLFSAPIKCRPEGVTIDYLLDETTAFFMPEKPDDHLKVRKNSLKPLHNFIAQKMEKMAAMFGITEDYIKEVSGTIQHLVAKVGFGISGMKRFYFVYGREATGSVLLEKFSALQRELPKTVTPNYAVAMVVDFVMDACR